MGKVACRCSLLHRHDYDDLHCRFRDFHKRACERSFARLRCSYVVFHVLYFCEENLEEDNLNLFVLFHELFVLGDLHVTVRFSQSGDGA